MDEHNASMAIRVVGRLRVPTYGFDELTKGGTLDVATLRPYLDSRFRLDPELPAGQQLAAAGVLLPEEGRWLDAQASAGRRRR